MPRAPEAAAEIRTGFAAIQSIDVLIASCVCAPRGDRRDAAYQREPAAAEALAFKIDSSLVPGLLKPLPWREVWVYSPRVEGIHLRGPAARGGLRWS